MPRLMSVDNIESDENLKFCLLKNSNVKKYKYSINNNLKIYQTCKT